MHAARQLVDRAHLIEPQPTLAGRRGEPHERRLAVVNSVLIGAYSALLGSDINRSLVFFFGLLLTMIIVLYDRFLGERAARTAIA